MLTCQQITELVTDYLEGRLTLRRRVAFHLHLGMCGRCRAYLRQMRLTIRTVGKLDADAAPPMSADVREELLKRFRNFKR